jgi:hypothetical protein
MKGMPLCAVLAAAFLLNAANWQAASSCDCASIPKPLAVAPADDRAAGLAFTHTRQYHD